MRQPPTLSDLLATARSETFIGREREQAWFNYELERATPQTVLWWLHGPPGVGKSALLHQWLLRAQSLGRATAVYDAEGLDPITVMAALATQLAAQGSPLQRFEQHYQIYADLWATIRTDPEAPCGLLAHRSSRTLPVLTRAQVEATSLSPRGLATHLQCRHHWSPEQIALALDGTRPLTESFVAGLCEVAADGGVVIAFDEWERIGPWLERWLVRLLSTHAMRLPAAITWVVASHGPRSDAWAPLAAATAVVTLDPLVPAHARQLISLHDKLEAEIETRLPGPGSDLRPPPPMLPLWLEPLVGIVPDENSASRLLDSLSGHRERAVLLAAAITRRLDPTSFKAVLGRDEAPEAAEWLAQLSHAPYTQLGSGDRLQMRAVVRTTLLRYLRRENPLDEAEGHLALAEANLPPATRLYHRLMACRAHALPEFLDALLDAAERDAAALPTLGEILLAAACDSGSRTLSAWAAQLQAIVASDDPVSAAQALARALLGGNSGAGAPIPATLPPLPPASRARLLLLLGQSFETTDWTAARACYAEATTIEPSRADAWFHLGRAHLAAGDSDAALAALTQAEQLAPQFPRILHARALALRRLGQLAQASAVLDRALILAPTDPDLLTLRGDLLGLQGDSTGALAAYGAAFAEDERALLAWVGRAELLAQLDRLPEALDAFEHALEIAPDAAFILVGKGEVLRQMKRLDEAVTDFVSAVTLNPADVFAWSNMGKTLRQMSRFEEALSAFDSALSHDPTDLWALALRGETLFQLSRYEEALATLDEALRHKPDLPFVVAVRGEVLRELGEFSAALAAFDRALELTPDYAWALASKGQTLRRMDRLEEALAATEQAITLTPDDPWMWAEKGETLRLMGRFDDARLALEQAVALDADYAWAWSTLAQTLRTLEDLPTALNAVERALDGAPEVLWLCAEQVELLLLLHRYDQAAAVARAHAERDPDNDWAHFLVAVAAQARNERREFNAAISQAVRLASANLNRAEDDDQQARALFNRALYRLVQANPGASREDYESALALEREDRAGDALEDLNFLEAVGVWMPTWERARARLEAWITGKHQHQPAGLVVVSD